MIALNLLVVSFAYGMESEYLSRHTGALSVSSRSSLSAQCPNSNHSGPFSCFKCLPSKASLPLYFFLLEHFHPQFLLSRYSSGFTFSVKHHLIPPAGRIVHRLIQSLIASFISIAVEQNTTTRSCLNMVLLPSTVVRAD